MVGQKYGCCTLRYKITHSIRVHTQNAHRATCIQGHVPRLASVYLAHLGMGVANKGAMFRI